MFVLIQIAAPTTVTRKTTKRAVSAAHIVFCCQGVGYLFMQASRSSLSVFAEEGQMLNRHFGYWSGFGFAGAPLLIVVRVLSIFSANCLFWGSSVIAFCHASNAWGTRFNFK